MNWLSGSRILHPKPRYGNVRGRLQPAERTSSWQRVALPKKPCLVSFCKTSHSETPCTKLQCLVCDSGEGHELTIWNSTESEFATGLEYQRVFGTGDQIQDLDWTATPDGQSILAVGFAHRVELLCQQRMTYFDNAPGWGVCWKVDFTRYVPSFAARRCLQ